MDAALLFAADVTDPHSPIGFLLAQRRQLGWNVTLPVFGFGASVAMQHYVDRVDGDGLTKTRDDTGHHVTCVTRSDVDTTIIYSPYDLCVTASEQEAARASSGTYYAISATNVVRVDTRDVDGRSSVQVTRAMHWLWEKVLFDRLRTFRVFALFRKRRTFKCWRANMRGEKQERARVIITRRLFASNEVFQRVLLHVRALCERASGSLTGDGVQQYAITMLRYNATDTLNLSDFQAAQNAQIAHALSQLHCLKEEVMNLTYMSCIVRENSKIQSFHLNHL